MIGKLFTFVLGFFMGTIFGWKVLEWILRFILESLR